MKTDKKRYLSYYTPEILQKKELPVNFKFAQFYTMDTRTEENKDKSIAPLDKSFLEIKVNAYKTNCFNIMATLGKPISKIIR